MDLSPGTILLGKYRIDALIGTGGMGNVVRASHLYLHQAVAIKLLLPELALSDATVQRFLREAQSTVKLRSEHIARVMDVGTTPEGVPFMVMEYLEGNDLNQILRHHGPQQPPIVVDLMLQACEGIAEAHALGIVHRDIKPSNFFITRRPDGSMLLKILDFGISKTPIGYGELTGTQTVMGTPAYMAPEQMKSGRAADPRSDVWSIGIVLYQLLTGRPPFAGESYAELVLKVGLEPPQPLHVPLPPGLAEIVMRCLEKEPGSRFQTVAELARMLAPYASDPTSAAQSAARAQRILDQRSQLHGMAGPLTLGGGLPTPVPISPAQLTPSHSWPPSQGSSLSHGVGQVTMRGRGAQSRLIAGIVGMCVLAGVGGYAISQLSRSSDPVSREPHVHVPAPTAEPTAAALPAVAEPVPPPPPVEPPPATTAAPPPDAAPGGSAITPTIVDRPADTGDGSDGSHRASKRLVDNKPAAETAGTRATRSSTARSSDAKSTESKSGKSSKSKSSKSKSSDDLFGSRQ